MQHVERSRKRETYVGADRASCVVEVSYRKEREVGVCMSGRHRGRQGWQSRCGHKKAMSLQVWAWEADAEVTTSMLEAYLVCCRWGEGTG